MGRHRSDVAAGARPPRDTGFDTAAFTAAQAGEELIEPHTELEARRQQELYVVLRGRASFTVDGEPVDAEAGTFVFVGDPAVHRAAVAAESGTSVLVIGGEPTFTPSGHEYMNRVRARLPADPRRLAAAVREAPELADEGRSDGIANLLENAGSHGTNVRSPP